MKCKDIIRELEKTYPVSVAESWDNLGLQAGRYEKEITSIYVALDATEQVIHHAIEEKADLLLTHHPMLMHGLKKINTGDFYGRRIIELLSHDMTCYAMHTNYDIVQMASLAAQMLRLQDTEILTKTCVLPNGEDGGFGRVGMLEKPMSLEECARYVKEVFKIPEVKVFGDGEKIVQRAAILPGSGKSMVQDVLEKQADVYISGDFGHHDGIDALDQGLPVIDAGHYGIEHIFIAQMAEELKRRFPQIHVISEPIQHPFIFV